MTDIVSYVLINLIRITVAAILGIITYYGLPLLKNTIVPWLKEKHLYGVVLQMVQAAEKLAETETISKADKKNYVESQLTNHGITVNTYVDALIESAVKEVDERTGALITDAIDVLSADDVAELTAEEGETTDGSN